VLRRRDNGLIFTVTQGETMHVPIEITAGNVILKGELFDSSCASAVVEALPLDVAANRWGDELYFGVPLEYPLDKTATTNVKIGDIGFWPPSSALAFFLGPTPISRGVVFVPASSVNVVGHIIWDATVLKTVNDGGRIRIERR
jgi:uncharacterized protein